MHPPQFLISMFLMRLLSGKRFPLAFFLLICLFGAPVTTAVAQGVVVQIDPTPVDMIRLSDFDPIHPEASAILFSVTLVNDNERRNLVVEVDVGGTQAGFLGTLMHRVGIVQPNQSVLLTNRDFDDYEFTDAADELAAFVLARGQVPVDEYYFNARVIDVLDGDPINLGEAEGLISTSSDATQIDAVSPGQPLGGIPESVVNPKPVFYWQSDATQFEVELFEVQPGQVAQQDIVTNFPVFRQRVENQTSLTYPAFATELKPGRVYAWQVSAIASTISSDRRFSSEMYWFYTENSTSTAESDIPSGLSELRLEPQELTAATGEAVQFSLTGYSVQGLPIDNLISSWTVLPASAGTITSSGLFTPSGKNDLAIIKVQAGEIVDHSTVMITNTGEGDSDLELIAPTAGETTPPRPYFEWASADTSARKFTVEVKDLESGETIWRHEAAGWPRMEYPSMEASLTAGKTYSAEITAVLPSSDIIQSAPIAFAVEQSAKISHELAEAIAEAERGGNMADSATVLVKLDRLITENLRSRILDAGAEIVLVEHPWIQIRVPFHAVAALSELSAIEIARLPSPHQIFGIGDAGTIQDDDKYANLPQIDGEEIHVAVLEFGFDKAAITSVLGDKAVFHSFRQDRKIEGSSSTDALHGVLSVRAMSDFLPQNAVVHLINFDTEPEFQQALRYAVNNLGVRVVTCSVSWSNAYDDYDGTSTFARTVSSILGNKAAMTVAAGNFAKSHWEATFSDVSRNGIHRFGNRDYLDLKLSSKKSYNILLSWNDWSGPSTDLDMEIQSSSGDPLLSRSGKPFASRNRQSRDGYTEPVERISNFRPFLPGTQSYRLVITQRENALDRQPKFELYIYPPPEGASVAPVTSSSLASGVATANSPAVVPIGADGFTHSSDGPTNDGRPRPQFVADGEVSWNNRKFEGTSFATPRVAGLLASVLSRHPTWTYRQGLEYIDKFRVDSGSGASIDLAGALTSLAR